MKALLGALLMATSSGALAATPEYHDFQGARIGITQSEWKALPVHLSANQIAMSGYSNVGAPVAWCEGDAPMKGYREKPIVKKWWGENELGVIACKYVMPGKVAGIKMVIDMPQDVGTSWVNGVTYKFLDGRLFSIEMEGSGLIDVMRGLEARWGPAEEDRGEDLVNGFGVVAHRTQLVWKAPGSKIEYSMGAGPRGGIHLVYSSIEGERRIAAWKTAHQPDAAM